MSTMAPLTGIDLFKTLHAVAIAGWATIVTINNVQTFAATTSTVGRTMSMALLRQDPPVDTPLLCRATASRALHRVALAIIVLLQAFTAIAMWGACGCCSPRRRRTRPRCRGSTPARPASPHARSCCCSAGCGTATGYARKACN